MRNVIITAVVLAVSLAAQPPTPPVTQSTPTGAGGQQITLDLVGAIGRARTYSQQYLQAYIAAGLAREDRVQAKAALFPTLTALNQYIYTQANGTPSGVFISNDGVHVYNEQAVVHAELFSLAKRAEYQRTLAAESAARARQEIAARGLVGTVVLNYYTLVTAERHESNAGRGLDEARTFFEITQKQERGGEVARADVIKAQLQLKQRERDLLDAQAAALKARIALGVMLFPDPSQTYAITDDLAPDLPLAPLGEINPLARANSPDIHAAEAGLRQSSAAIRVAQGAYYPSLMIDYFYGINSNVFDSVGPGDRKNLGSALQATLTVPIWNWGATRSKVRQAELQKQQAGYDLTFAQRGLQSALDTLYIEAQASKSQLESLRGSQDLSTESLRLTVLRYKAGEATALEVADAQTTLVQSRNALDDGLARYRIALAGLQNLTGRL